MRMAVMQEGTDLCGRVDKAAAVRRAAAGDREAFEELMDAYHRRIFAMVYSRITSRMDAEDITQEIFVRAFQGVRSLRDPQLFKPWLYRIALNAINDFLRKKRLRSIFTLFTRERDDSEVPDPIRGGSDYLERKEFWTRLNEFFSRLSPSEREVFRLKFLDGLCIREIAEVMEKNESTIKTHLYRAVEKFRRESDLSGFLKEEKA